MNYLERTRAFTKRTSKFGGDIINLVMSVKPNHVNKSILSQLIRSSTSIGANYCEASNASSKKDFRNKIFICKKEAQETQHWLQMLSKSNAETTNMTRKYWRECHEFIMIFQAIINSLNKRKNLNGQCLNGK